MSSGSAEAVFNYESEPVSTEESGDISVADLENVVQLYPRPDHTLENAVSAGDQLEEELDRPDVDEIAQSKNKYIYRRHSLEQERRLLFRAKMGDEEALGELLEANQWIVRYLAVQFTGPGVDFDELVQVGSIELWKAIPRKDTYSAMRLSTYAHDRIRFAMLDLLEKSKPINKRIVENLKETDFSDLATDQSTSSNPLENLIDASNQSELKTLLSTKLTDEERRAIELRFGLEDGKEHRLHAIGKAIYPEGTPLANTKENGAAKSHESYEMYGFRLVQRALKKLRGSSGTDDSESARLFLHEYLAFIDEHKAN